MLMSKNLRVSFALNLLLFVAFYSFFGAKFISNDDTMMLLESSGMLTGTPSAFLINTNIIIGYILSALYGFVPSLPWYTLNLIFTLFLVCVLFYYVLLEKAGIKYGTYLFLVFMALSGFVFMFNLQFTIVSILAVSVGFSVLLYEFFIKETAGRIVVALAAFLIIWGSFIRFNSMPLGIFISTSVFVLSYLLKINKVNYNKFVLKAALILGILVLSFGFRAFHLDVYESSASWKGFHLANRVKAKIIDYKILDADDKLKSDVFAESNWSDINYTMYKYRFFVDSNVFYLNKKILTRIYNTKVPLKKEVIEKRAKTFPVRIKSDINSSFYKYFFYSLFLVFSFIVLWVLIEFKVKNLVFVLLSTLGVWAIMVLITVLMKAPPVRVLYPGFIAAFMSIFIMMPVYENKPIAKMPFVTAVIFVLAIIYFGSWFKKIGNKRDNFTREFLLMSRNKTYVYWLLPGFEYLNPFSNLSGEKMNGFVLGTYTLSDEYRQYYNSGFFVSSAIDFVDNPDVVICIRPNNKFLIKYLREFYKEKYGMETNVNTVFNNEFMLGLTVESVEE